MLLPQCTNLRELRSDRASGLARPVGGSIPQKGRFWGLAFPVLESAGLRSAPRKVSHKRSLREGACLPRRLEQTTRGGQQPGRAQGAGGRQGWAPRRRRGDPAYGSGIGESVLPRCTPGGRSAAGGPQARAAPDQEQLPIPGKNTL